MKLYFLAIFLLIYSHAAYAPMFEIMSQEATPTGMPKKNALEAIQTIIANRSNPNILISEHYALWYAANYGEYELAHKLLKLGANPDLTSTTQCTTALEQSLHMAKLDVFELLLAYNANPNRLLAQTSIVRKTYLHWLSMSHNYLPLPQRLLATQILLSYGAQINVRLIFMDNPGLTVLEYARAEIPGSPLLLLLEDHAKEFKLQKLA